jgi:PBSX family phage terminase large subunit
LEFKTFSKKQLLVLSWWCRNSPHRERDAIICDGAVRSGKSLCMFISFVSWAFYAFSDASFAVCGKTVSSIKRNLIGPMRGVLEDIGFSVKVLESKNRMEIRRDGRVNIFYLFGGKDEASAALIQGMTLSGVLLDEVALMPRSFVEQALARCSVEGSKFWFNCNPEHPGHWFYNEWIKKCGEKNALYLHFTMRENPSLSEHMLKRYASLYSGPFYERFVEGKWVAASGLVYPMFGERMLSDPPEECSKYYISVDYGTVNPTSMGLWGESGGVWYRLKEYYYASRREGAQKTDEEYYAALDRLAGGREIEAVICDPSAASFITCIARKGKYRPVAADNHVLAGIRLVSDLLQGGRIRICRGCVDAIREFSLYVWDENRREDCVKKENDHAMDDIRYFAATVLGRRPGGFAASAVRR